jgi:DNA polymerase, archaea type
VRLTKSPEQYLATRASRREVAYEALLADRRTAWRVGDRVHVYRKRNGEAGLVDSRDDDTPAPDPRDYEVDYYVRLLRSSFAARLARAFAPEDFEVVFADADQLALFCPSLDAMRPILRLLPAQAW